MFSLQLTVAVCRTQSQLTVVLGIKFKNMDFKKLIAYQKSFELAMSIFEITKSFPKEERYSLTDQIRRSSRSVSANIAESYR